MIQHFRLKIQSLRLEKGRKISSMLKKIYTIFFIIKLSDRLKSNTEITQKYNQQRRTSCLA